MLNFRGVCAEKSERLSFNKTSLCSCWVTCREICVLKGFCCLEVSFDVKYIFGSKPLKKELAHQTLNTKQGPTLRQTKILRVTLRTLERKLNKILLGRSPVIISDKLIG